MNKRKPIKASDFLWLALTAFGGLGLEVILAYLIEQPLYGLQMKEWLTWQSIFHWCVTCFLWGIVSIYLVRTAKRNYGFDLFQKAEPMKKWQWGVVIACILFMLVMSYSDWNGPQIIREYQAKGWLKFIFQYLYYLFETVLFMLIIVFGQKAFELWFKNTKIPYGGITVALTWGLVHTLTKGSLQTGMMAALGGFIFGVVYLLVNRDIKKTYVFLFIMFAL